MGRRGKAKQPCACDRDRKQREKEKEQFLQHNVALTRRMVNLIKT